MKVCGDVKPITETEAVPSPVRSNVPVNGALLNVTEISAVKVSSVTSEGVPLSLQIDSLDDAIADILQGLSISIIAIAVLQMVLSAVRHIVYSTL